MTSVARKRLLKNRRLTPWSISPASERVVPFPQSALSLQFLHNRAFVKGVKQNLFDVVTFTRGSGGGRTNAQGNYEWVGNDVPRIDYGYEVGPNGDLQLRAKGILIEEQRTNLLTYSEQFDNAAWQKFAAIVTTNAAVSPDGTSNADKLIADTTNASHYIRQIFSFTASTSYTLTVFAKAAEKPALGLTLPAVAFSGIDQAVGFDLVAKTTTVRSGSPSATIADVGGGWVRCSITATASASASNAVYVFAYNSASGASVYTGNGVDGIYIWGAQLEAGAFPTSYIPTVASQVTRSADVVSVNTLAPWYNASEGSLVVAYRPGAATSAGTARRVASLSDGTLNNRIVLSFSDTSGIADAFVTVGGVSQLNILTPIQSLTRNNAALAYKSNDFGYSLNGGLITQNSGSIPSPSILYIGCGEDGVVSPAVSPRILNGHIQSLEYFDYKFSPEDLRSITTPQTA